MARKNPRTSYRAVSSFFIPPKYGARLMRARENVKTKGLTIYVQLPPIVHIIDKLEPGQTRGHVHTMKIKPMVNGICQSGCGFTHQPDPMKCHSDLVYLPLKECPYRDTIGDDDSNFQVYCPHACGKVIYERGSFIKK